MNNKEHKIGNIISRLRKEKGWTQSRLAEKLQVSDKAISKWEANNGTPSIEFLPLLAKLFNVTIDYLMTGEEPEEKVVLLTKLELCAKNDDVDGYKGLNLSLEYQDENRKNILDYIFTYQSKTLFSEIVINNKYFETNYLSRMVRKGEYSKTFYENVYYMRLLCNDQSVVRDFVRLEYAKTTIEQPLNLKTDFIYYNGHRVPVPRKIVSDRMIDYILYGKDINQELKKCLIDNYNDSSARYYAPAFSYPYYILYAMKKGDWELAELLIQNAIKFNDENHKALGKDPHHIEEVVLCYINLPKEVFEFALENEQYHIVQLGNCCNKYILENPNKGNCRVYNDKMVYVADEYTIYANKIKFDSVLTQSEKDLALCIHDGVVCLDELIALNNFELYEKMIKKYPISKYEKSYNEILFNEDLTKEVNYNYIKKYANKNVDFNLAKEYLFLEKVLDKDIRFIEKACKNASQEELDKALNQVEPNNFKAINILLNYGAKLHKCWEEDDGWGYIAHDVIDEIGTEILKKKIQDVLGEK